MSQLRFVPFVIFICLLNFHASFIECRPYTQTIVIHGHEWTVPNEPGWEDVVQEADSIRRRLLSNCVTTRDCLLAAEQLRQVFLKHPISSKYYDDSTENDNIQSLVPLIFRWG